MLGDFYVFNVRPGNWFSKAQRFFTRRPFTHVAVGAGKLGGVDSVLSADLVVTVCPLFYWSSKDTYCFAMTAFTKAQIATAYARTYTRFSGTKYGFMQILWFVWRYIGETFGVDMRKKPNFFPNAVICSELGWWALYYLAEQAGKQDIIDKLNEWNSNSFHSADMYDVLVWCWGKGYCSREEPA
jgi:hypothetical protein